MGKKSQLLPQKSFEKSWYC